MYRIRYISVILEKWNSAPYSVVSDKSIYIYMLALVHYKNFVSNVLRRKNICRSFIYLYIDMYCISEFFPFNYM